MRLITFPSLLMWHWYFLAWLAGLWGVRFLVPSLVVLAAVLFFHVFSLFSSSKHKLAYSFGSVRLSGVSAISVRLLFLFAFFVVGLTVGNASLPERPYALQEPETLPAFVRNKQKVLVQGVVHEVLTSPDRRVKFILSDVKYTLPEEEPKKLPGNVVWTWANWRDGVRKQTESGDTPVPLLRPMVGETVSLKARLMPVVGFRNKGTWSSGDYWQDRGVFWRMWTWGNNTIPHRSGSPSKLAEWREKLRFHVSQLLAAEENTSFLARQIGKLSSIAWRDALRVVPALLFGDKYGFPSDRYEQLSRASLSHSFALSGMHLGIVALGITFLLSLCVRRAEWYEVISRSKLFAMGILPATAVYVWIGGASPSLVRAFVMCACWCLLVLLNRPKVFMDGVFIALVLLTIWNPLIVFDLRLQLSALAIVAMALALPFSRAIKEKIFRQPATSVGQKIKCAAFDTFFFSTVIQLVLFPVVIWNFNEVSMWTVLNMLWLPLLGMLIMPMLLLGLVVAWCSMVFSPLMGVAQELFTVSATPVALLFAFLDDLERAGLLNPIIVARPNWLTIIGWYGTLTSCVAWWNIEGKTIVPRWLGTLSAVFSVREKRFYQSLGLPLLGDSLQKQVTEHGELQFLARSVSTPSSGSYLKGDGKTEYIIPPAGKHAGVCVAARLSICLFVCVLLSPSVSKAYSAYFGKERKTVMQVLDVGQGQAILLNFPNGKRLLLDGGGFSSRSFDIGKALVMPCITRQHDTRLQWVVSTHPDTDHIRGLFYPLAYGDVGKYLATDAEVRGWNKKQLRAALKKSGVGKRVLAKGDVLTVSENLELEVLHPDREGFLEGNNKSLVLRLVKNEGTERVGLALLTGDIELEGINTLLASGADLSAKVLILPHHGSGTSFSERFYEAVEPQIAIASCGYLNKYGFPDKRVRLALESKGIPVVTTAIRGEIDITLD